MNIRDFIIRSPGQQAPEFTEDGQPIAYLSNGSIRCHSCMSWDISYGIWPEHAIVPVAGSSDIVCGHCNHLIASYSDATA